MNNKREMHHLRWITKYLTQKNGKTLVCKELVISNWWIMVTITVGTSAFASVEDNWQFTRQKYYSGDTLPGNTKVNEYDIS